MKYIYLLFFLILTFPATAQFGGLKNYTKEDGLNAAITYSIRQDNKGFIWIGSDNGLFRFDGTNFKQYNQKDGLKNIDVLGIVPMRNGDIFILPYLNDFGVYKNGQITTAENNRELKKIEGVKFNRKLISFSNAAADTFIIMEGGNPSNVIIFSNGKVSVVPIAIDYKAISKKYNGTGFPVLTYTNDGNLYLLSADNKVICYNTHTRGITTIATNIKEKNLLFNPYESGITGICTDKRLYLYDCIKGKLTSHDFPGKIFWSNLQNDKLWVAFTDGGVAYFDNIKDPELKHPRMFMDGNIVTDAMLDRDGNVWFSTRTNGVFFMANQLFNNALKFSINNNTYYITAMAANSRAIFLGYDNGKAAVYQDGKIIDFSLDKGTQYDLRSIFAIDSVLLYGYGSYLYAVDPKKENAVAIRNEVNVVKHIVPYKQNHVLICGSNFLTAYNFVTGANNILLDEKTYSALPYSEDSLFVGTFKDLFKFNTLTKQKTLFLSGYYFTDLIKLQENLFAGSTNGNGIFLFNSHKILHHISEKEGLASNQVKRIRIENASTFWAATSSGLCRIYLNNDEIKINNFTRAEGLPSDYVTDCIVRNDTVYAGTAKGLAILPVKNLLQQKTYIEKKVLIESVAFGDSTILEPTAISATYPVNTITLDLCLLDYNSLRQVSYKYMVEGLDKNWQISTSSKIILNTLPPGKYVFKVYGLSYNGKSSKTYTSLLIHIKPQFWQTWWFQTIVLVILCGIIIMIINEFIRRKRNKKLKALFYEKKVAELELQAIKAQINPHFIYNCLNSIQFLLYKKDYAATENYLDTFAGMIRKTLHYSENTFTTLSEETEYLGLYLAMEKLRFKSNFDYKIIIAENVTRDLKIPSLLIQPFVENAIKHGISKTQNGNIVVAFEYSKPTLSITITDNGPGIKDENLLLKKTNSLGIKLTQKRIDTFHQLFGTNITLEITDLSERGCRGTEIKLFLLLK